MFPATVRLAVRAWVALLTATVMATFPLPVADSPEVTAIQGAGLEAVQVQALCDALTAMTPKCVLASNERVRGSTVKRQVSPAWVT